MLLQTYFIKYSRRIILYVIRVHNHNLNEYLILLNLPHNVLLELGNFVKGKRIVVGGAGR